MNVKEACFFPLHDAEFERRSRMSSSTPNLLPAYGSTCTSQCDNYILKHTKVLVRNCDGVSSVHVYFLCHACECSSESEYPCTFGPWPRLRLQHIAAQHGTFLSQTALFSFRGRYWISHCFYFETRDHSWRLRRSTSIVYDRPATALHRCLV